MCLGIPGQVVAIDAEGNATVDFWGVRRKVRLELLDEPVRAGDYVLNHVGYAIRRIPDDAIQETLGLYEILLSEAGEDPLAIDVSTELCATPE